VSETGEIGYFKLTSEASVAAGIRRIEAITGEKAQAYINEQLQLIDELKNLLKNPKSLPKAIESLLEENQKLSKQIEFFEREQEKLSKQSLLQQIVNINELSVLISESNLPQNAIKNIAFQLRNEVENLFMVLISTGEKPVITIAFSDNLVKEKQLHAGNLVSDWAKEINGGGGGQAFFATAGGSNSKGIAEVLRKAKELVNLV
jgi:alanyl-tRNA synthetase